METIHDNMGTGECQSLCFSGHNDFTPDTATEADIPDAGAGGDQNVITLIQKMMTRFCLQPSVLICVVSYEYLLTSLYAPCFLH